MDNTLLEFLETEGAVYVKDVIPLELAKFLTHVLLRKSTSPDSHGDSQVSNAKAIIDHEFLTETLLEDMWPKLESLLNTELLPTYAYSRLYGNGDKLEKHIDRPACEVSMTIQLGRSHNYSWPIFMGNKRYDLAETEGVVYLGTKIEHWRDTCAGPEDYYSGQIFLHYVRKNGDYADQACDSTVRKPWSNMFVLNRNHLMRNK